LPAAPGVDMVARPPVLSLRDVRVTFSGRSAQRPVRAVDGVDLDVAAGEVVALVGESGCGKSTLVRSVIGLEPLAGGSIVIDGAPLGRRAAQLRGVRRRVQMIFQDPSGALNPRHTVFEAVAEGLRIHRVPGHEPTLVAEALASAGLRPAERYVDRYPHELSGGQRQRVLIAAAMALQPDLLLADEPVASLDASIRGEVLALMRSYVDQRGIGIVAVTHDLGLAWTIADRVAVMYLGRVVEVGPTEAVLASPQHPYTRALLSVVPEIDAGGTTPQNTTSRTTTPQILIGETPDPAAIPPGCRFHPRCPVVASGEADRLGFGDRCRGSDPVAAEVVMVSVGTHHQAACHAIGR
jgi:oligopeptide/dipeptide ABC transporter ATP-binding protein